jgi:hypothetical protein
MGLETRREGGVKRNGLRIFTGFVITLVIAAIGTGLFIAGSPGRERMVKFDDQRLNELQQIAGAVDAYYEQSNGLPEDAALLKNSNLYYVNSFADPKTGTPYEYRKTSDTTYELCATFDLPTPPKPVPPEPMRPIAKPFGGSAFDTQHAAGRHCFTLNAEERVVRPSCGLRNPCQAGQTCAVLPGKTTAACVPQGQECLAAGCAANECVLMESYPVQVRCNN